MKASEDVMIDLETTGVKAGCGILSIGACTFDQSLCFYQKILIDSCHSYGLADDPSTIAWWHKQSVDARDEAFSGTLELHSVLGQLSDWFRRLDSKKVFVWGNGADFDLPILSAAYSVIGMKQPWEPFNGRCYRTLKNLYPAIKMQPFEGTKHSALADARNQAQHAVDILRIHFAE